MMDDLLAVLASIFLIKGPLIYYTFSSAAATPCFLVQLRILNNTHNCFIKHLDGHRKGLEMEHTWSYIPYGMLEGQ